MALYEYYCRECGDTFEANVPMEERDGPVGTPCRECGGPLSRSIGNKGGFRLDPNGSVGWSDDGYASTLGDSHKFKTGQKL